MKQRRAPSYAQTITLCALVLAGWVWDLALGGAAVHAWAWLGALVLVGGISALAVRSARSQHLSEQPAVAEEPLPDEAIRIAEQDDLATLADVERAADVLFEVRCYGSMPGPATLHELEGAALLLVAGRPAIGYLRVDVHDGVPHIEQVSVRPKFMKHGIGTALIEVACAWAAEQGYQAITLCTFADVPWNAPFYAKLGFGELDGWPPALQPLRYTEILHGLDRIGRRVVMRRSLR